MGRDDAGLPQRHLEWGVRALPAGAAVLDFLRAGGDRLGLRGGAPWSAQDPLGYRLSPPGWVFPWGTGYDCREACGSEQAPGFGRRGHAVLQTHVAECEAAARKRKNVLRRLSLWLTNSQQSRGNCGQRRGKPQRKPKPSSCWPRFTAGSPKALIPKTCKRPRRLRVGLKQIVRAHPGEQQTHPYEASFVTSAELISDGRYTAQ